MAVNDVVMTMNGIVSYTDGSWASFGSQLGPNSNISISSDNVEIFRQLWAGGGETLTQATVNLLGGFAFTVAPPTTSKTVRAFTLNISGIVSSDDQTHGNFGVQYTPLTGSFLTLAGSDTQWDVAMTSATFKALMDTMVETICGTVTLS